MAAFPPPKEPIRTTTPADTAAAVAPVAVPSAGAAPTDGSATQQPPPEIPCETANSPQVILAVSWVKHKLVFHGCKDTNRVLIIANAFRDVIENPLTMMGVLSHYAYAHLQASCISDGGHSVPAHVFNLTFRETTDMMRWLENLRARKAKYTPSEWLTKLIDPAQQLPPDPAPAAPTADKKDEKLPAPPAPTAVVSPAPAPPEATTTCGELPKK